MENREEGAVEVLSVLTPVRAKSPNETSGEHWANRMKRARLHKEAAYVMLKRAGEPRLPCRVTLTRIAPSNGLDEHDNLRHSMKNVADGVAAWLGVDDDDPRIYWDYAQERGKTYGVRIEVERRALA